MNLALEQPTPTRNSAPRAHSPRARAAAHRFALDLEAPPPRAVPARLDAPARTITLLLGPSASGKTTTLRAAARALRHRGVHTIDPARLDLPDKPTVDCFRRRSLDDAMRLLATAGLADARCFVARPSELSQGQRDRLRLALAIDRVPTDEPAALVADEFAARLDQHTARSLATAVRKTVDRTPNLRAIIATPRDDLEGRLRPDAVVRCALGREPSVERPDPRPEPDDVVIERGAPADYDALAHFHYRAARPVGLERVLAAREKTTGTLAGALVVARPPLNAPHRRLAWPSLFPSALDKRTNARRLNADLRTIARIVVDPRFRARSLATRLVRAYLADPATPLTECLAAMGRFCPFLRRAGMTEYRLPPSRRDARLLDALAHAGFAPEDLAAPRALLDHARRSGAAAFLERELHRWTADSRATARHNQSPTLHKLRLAARRLIPTPTAYAHTAT